VSAALARVRQSRVVAVGGWLVGGTFVLWALARLLGIDSGFPLTPLFAFTPYIAVIAVIAGGLLLVLRHWGGATLAVVAFLLLAILIVPRALGGADEIPPDDTRLVVVGSNLYFGEANVDELVGLVRELDADVLTTPELTPNAVRRLEAAGIDELLPHHVLAPDSGADGTGLYSRYPLRPLDLQLGHPGGFAFPAATVELPGGQQIEIVAVHTIPPTSSGNVANWGTDMDSLPAAGDGGPIRILVGDFNATLDQSRLRDVVGRGYRDAADAVGAGLTPTWPQPGYRHRSVPLTIDHVLVDERLPIADYDTHDIADTDHRAVSAVVGIPPG
jgi:endonuclease/exonuclease/phosphatase (EEP) superfamily protein YafD